MKYTEEDIPPGLAKIIWGMMDACNSSGIILSFAKDVLPELCSFTVLNGKSTQWRNQHPLITLYIDKLAQLNGRCLFCDDGKMSILEIKAEQLTLIECYSLVKKVVEANKC